MTSLQGKLFSEYTTLEPLTVETTCAIFQDSNFYEKALLELKVAGEPSSSVLSVFLLGPRNRCRVSAPNPPLKALG